MESQTRFSTNFLDELNVVQPPSTNVDTTVQPDATTQQTLSVANDDGIEKRFSDHFADTELDIHPHDSGFDFASNLQTHDSISSLNDVGLTADPMTDSPSHEVATEEVSAQMSGSWETFDENGKQVCVRYVGTDFCKTFVVMLFVFTGLIFERLVFVLMSSD